MCKRETKNIREKKTLKIAATIMALVLFVITISWKQYFFELCSIEFRSIETVYYRNIKTKIPISDLKKWKITHCVRKSKRNREKKTTNNLP